MAFLKAGWGPGVIAEEISRSRTVVDNFIKLQDKYGTATSRGQPPKLTPLATRRIFREASKGQASAHKLVIDLDLPVSARRVQQLLHEHPEFVYKKRLGAPKLSERHITARLQWARDQVISRRDWSDAVFSDKKKFNLDGPDGWQFYWHHLQHDEQLYSRRQNGGGGMSAPIDFQRTIEHTLGQLTAALEQQQRIMILLVAAQAQSIQTQNEAARQAAAHEEARAAQIADKTSLDMTMHFMRGLRMRTREAVQYKRR
ncbi:hypothetical protein ACHHYP_06555 [Achlya hypogyna]|uniref:Transposase Tc1-like domain-containing protein n=1 Tax=Achlya hypogyna TaxID=1202772 RepID=A0A1V9YTN6_ACHHY|nr:hypothetical protein ACHHYP_06555 [Achlya hypogyna]